MTNSISNNSLRKQWDNISPFAGPPIAASLSIIPVFWLFMAKSARQLNEPLPIMPVTQALRLGIYTSPLVGAITGAQLLSQRKLEKSLSTSAENIQTIMVSTVGVAIISAPLLVAFNGKSMGKSVKESLKHLTFRQVSTIVVRETSFLFSIRISNIVGKIIKDSFGDNKVVEHSSIFATGFIGSLIGHPADTALTLQQKARNFSFRNCLKGSLLRGSAIGGFAILYKISSEALESV